MYVFAIVNAKGGVGKTTTAAALLAALTKSGAKTLALELDPQGNLSNTIGAVPNVDLLEILQGKEPAINGIVKTNAGDILPATKTLSLADDKQCLGSSKAVKTVINSFSDTYDYVIIDNQPHQGTLMLNSLVAANAVIIPANADPYNLTAIPDIIGTIKAVKKKANPGLEIAGILVTRYNGRSTLNKEALETLQELADKTGTRVFSATIRETVAIREAAAMKINIYDYAPKAKVTQDYKAFFKELMEIE